MIKEKRWAIAAKFDNGWQLLGMFCWPDGHRDEVPVRTFRTRKLAREARKQLRCYRENSRVVPVWIIVTGRG